MRPASRQCSRARTSRLRYEDNIYDDVPRMGIVLVEWDTFPLMKDMFPEAATGRISTMAGYSRPVGTRITYQSCSRGGTWISSPLR